jgi:hypothetical protein
MLTRFHVQRFRDDFGDLPQHRNQAAGFGDVTARQRGQGGLVLRVTRVRADQFKHAAFALGDVLDLEHEMAGRAIRITDERHVQLAPDNIPVLVQIPLLGLIILKLPGQQTLR